MFLRQLRRVPVPRRRTCPPRFLREYRSDFGGPLPARAKGWSNLRQQPRSMLRRRFRSRLVLLFQVGVPGPACLGCLSSRAASSSQLGVPGAFSPVVGPASGAVGIYWVGVSGASFSSLDLFQCLLRRLAWSPRCLASLRQAIVTNGLPVPGWSPRCSLLSLQRLPLC